jgi:hypothetical protein
MFRVLSTPIIRSTLTLSTASDTGHTSVQLPSSNVAEFKLYMFRVFSTPIIRSTLTVSKASGTGHTSVQLPSSNVAEIKLYMFRVLSTSIIRSTLTVSTASCRVIRRCSYLSPTWPSLFGHVGGRQLHRCMTCTGGCRYS